MTLVAVLASPLWLAILGAMVGGFRAGIMSWRKNGPARAFSDGLIGVVFAVAMAEWVTPPAYPKLAALIGLLAGTTGARALDAFFELVPEFVRELAMGWARKVTGSSGADRLRRASGWSDLQDSPRGRFTRDEDRHDQ